MSRSYKHVGRTRFSCNEVVFKNAGQVSVWHSGDGFHPTDTSNCCGQKLPDLKHGNPICLHELMQSPVESLSLSGENLIGSKDFAQMDGLGVSPDWYVLLVFGRHRGLGYVAHRRLNPTVF